MLESELGADQSYFVACLQTTNCRSSQFDNGKRTVIEKVIDIRFAANFCAGEARKGQAHFFLLGRDAVGEIALGKNEPDPDHRRFLERLVVKRRIQRPSIANEMNRG